jgi:hypothetical protein
MELFVPLNCDELLDYMGNYKLLKKGLCCMEVVCQVSGMATVLVFQNHGIEGFWNYARGDVSKY